jgi:hypothetical protein
MLPRPSQTGPPPPRQGLRRRCAPHLHIGLWQPQRLARLALELSQRGLRTVLPPCLGLICARAAEQPRRTSHEGLGVTTCSREARGPTHTRLARASQAFTCERAARELSFQQQAPSRGGLAPGHVAQRSGCARTRLLSVSASSAPGSPERTMFTRSGYTSTTGRPATPSRRTGRGSGGPDSGYLRDAHTVCACKRLSEWLQPSQQAAASVLRNILDNVTTFLQGRKSGSPNQARSKRRALARAPGGQRAPGRLGDNFVVAALLQALAQRLFVPRRHGALQQFHVVDRCRARSRRLAIFPGRAGVGAAFLEACPAAPLTPPPAISQPRLRRGCRSVHLQQAQSRHQFVTQ